MKVNSIIRIQTVNLFFFFFVDMQVVSNQTLEFHSKTLKNKDGQYPAWLSGRQRKRLQAREAVLKRNDKKKKTKTTTGKVQKRKVQKKKIASDKSEAMTT